MVGSEEGWCLFTGLFVSIAPRFLTDNGLIHRYGGGRMHVIHAMRWLFWLFRYPRVLANRWSLSAWQASVFQWLFCVGILLLLALLASVDDERDGRAWMGFAGAAVFITPLILVVHVWHMHRRRRFLRALRDPKPAVKEVLYQLRGGVAGGPVKMLSYERMRTMFQHPGIVESIIGLQWVSLADGSGYNATGLYTPLPHDAGWIETTRNQRHWIIWDPFMTEPLHRIAIVGRHGSTPSRQARLGIPVARLGYAGDMTMVSQGQDEYGTVVYVVDVLEGRIVHCF